MPRKPKNQAGFTLIEVLAALLVFSIAIIGLTHAGTESARAVAAINDKTLAGIVADNQLIMARRTFPQTGVTSGEVAAMSREFIYDVETTQTDASDLYRLTVKVRAKSRDQIIVERTAFQAGTP